MEEYGKKLPIADPIIYDDGSDMGKMTRLLEKLMLEDKVDFVLPPISTAFLYASGPLASKHGYILIGAEGGCTTLTDMLPELPYMFAPLNYSDHYQVPVLADLFVEWGVKTVYIIYIADLHGIEYSHTALSEFLKRGIQVVASKGVPPEATDLTPMLKEARDLNVDAFCSFTYPPVTMFVTGQAMELGYNPKAFVLGPGSGFEVFKLAFGPAVEGIIGFGAWNAKTSPAAAELADRIAARWGPEVLDWWGAILYWAALQHFEQSIVKAGTLDQKKIRDVMATEKFDTVLGPTWYDCPAPGSGGVLAEECYVGQVGQWQSGIFEVIDNDENRTAEPLYPKPAWPAPPAE